MAQQFIKTYRQDRLKLKSLSLVRQQCHLPLQSLLIVDPLKVKGDKTYFHRLEIKQCYCSLTTIEIDAEAEVKNQPINQLIG